MFNVIHLATQFKADVYIAARDPLHAWALAHRRRIDLEESGAWIAPPEYVIVRKLEYLREGGQDKHVRDIRFILAATALDRAFVDAEVARLGLELGVGAMPASERAVTATGPRPAPAARRCRSRAGRGAAQSFTSSLSILIAPSGPQASPPPAPRHRARRSTRAGCRALPAG